MSGSSISSQGDSIRANGQRFEKGFILHLRIPRIHAPNVWYVLAAEDTGPQFWSFITPVSFQKLDAPVYDPSQYAPPAGYYLPDAQFGGLWVVVHERLGWAAAPVEAYDIPYQREYERIPYLQPRWLCGPGGTLISLREDDSWEVVPAAQGAVTDSGQYR